MLGYKRPVDDSCYLASCAKTSAEYVSIMRTWHPSIDWELTGDTDEAPVHFLDLELSIDDGNVRIQTFRKPLNTYQYVQAASCHDQSTVYSIVTSEYHRLKRCNDTHERFQKHLQFFLKKLSNRGYRYKDLLTFVKRLENHQGPKHKQPLVKKVFFKTVHSSTLNVPFLRSCLSRHAYILERHFEQPIKFIVAKSVQRNIFRMLYKQNWIGDTGVFT